MSELEKIFLKLEGHGYYYREDAIKDIKKWAMGLLLKRKSYKSSLLKTEIDPDDYADGWNDYEEKFRKRIEEE